MGWLGLVVLGVVIVGGVVFALVALKALRATKTDGWSPAESVIGRKIWSKKRDRNIG
jgi:hypothetical protein